MPPQLLVDSRCSFDKTLLFGLTILSVIIQNLPDLGEALQWQRSATVPLHVFTTLTGHFTHWSWDHLLGNVAAFVDLGFTAIRVIPGRFVFCRFLSAVVIPIEIVLFQPQFETYRGQSGIDSALFELLIAGLWRQGRPVRYMALIGFIGFFGKTVFELVSGNSLFVEQSPETVIPVGSAHVIGFI
jgi:rhomboid family GlyGly-CTERM serine protease